MDEKKWVPVVRWIVRIWTLVPVLFIIGEIFFPHAEPSGVEWYEIFSLILLGLTVISLIAAWRWEALGGKLALGILVAFGILFMFTVERYFPAIIIILLALGMPAIGFILISRLSE
ncbi:MAG: hypothetical protein ABFS17_02735 [Chloroflexota bacterium]